MLKVLVVGNSDHDGDSVDTFGTLQQALDRWIAANSGQCDTVTIVIRKQNAAIVGRDLQFIPKARQ